MARPIVLGILVTVVLLAAGCTTDDSVTGASTLEERASKANAMLATPPWANVQPTGNVKEFTLTLFPMTQHTVYPGATMAMWAFSLTDDPADATVPGPTLRVTEGDLVRVTLRSTVAGFNHTLHWHGQHVPWEMDGVPFMSQSPVEPGEDFTYEFIAKPAGTYWYHCHVDAQHHIDMGMYGLLIVDPQDPAQDPAYDKEFLMVLDDMDRYHIEGGTPVASNTPQNLDPYSYEEWLRRQTSDAANRNSQVQDASGETGVRPQRSDEYGYPITHPTYTADYNTFLINGFAFPYTQPLLIDDDDIVRIRFVNVGNVPFAMHLHGHHMLVTHKDGILLESPYWVDTLPILPAERYDVYMKGENPGMWDFHDHIGGHTQNDNIFPGGAMTMLCYTSVEQCKVGGGGHEHGGSSNGRWAWYSGELLNWMGSELP